MYTLHYYKVSITRTAKYMPEDWQTYDNTEKTFKTEAEAREYVKNQYYYCKTKSPMYRDGKNGEAMRIGTIFSGKEKDQETRKTFYTRDWVEIARIEEVVHPIL